MEPQDFPRRRLATFLAAFWLFLMSVDVVWADPGLPRIGVLNPGGSFKTALVGLREGLRRQGYLEGKHFTLVVEDTQGATSGLDRYVANILTVKPSVLFTTTTALAMAAKKATDAVPLVFTLVSDPVKSGIIADYTSSGNNATGVTNAAGPLSGKRLELLKEIAPGTKNVLAVVSAKESIAQDSIRFLDEAATKLQVKVVRRDVTTKEEIEKVIAKIPKGTVDAIFHVPSTLVGHHIDILITKAKSDKLPLITLEVAMVRRGALLSYGPDLRLTGVQAARLVAKILNGEKPSAIPTESPEGLLFALNMNTARSIDLRIPRGVLDRIDRVIE